MNSISDRGQGNEFSTRCRVAVERCEMKTDTLAYPASSHIHWGRTVFIGVALWVLSDRLPLRPARRFLD